MKAMQPFVYRCKFCDEEVTLSKRVNGMRICDECRIKYKDSIPHSVSIPKPYSEWSDERKAKHKETRIKWVAEKLRIEPLWQKKQNAKITAYNKKRRLTDDAFRTKQNLATTNYHNKRYHNDPIYAEKIRKKRREKYAQRKALVLDKAYKLEIT